MLKSRISNVTNPPVDLAAFKAYIGGVNHTLQDDIIQRHLDAATIWASKKSNIPAADFDVELTQDKATLSQCLLFDNITITTVKDLLTGDEISYDTNAKNSVINTEVNYQLLVNYSCTAVSNPVLSDAILNYAVFLYSGQTDKDAEMRIIRDLQTIQSEIF
jgi:hypothetical protein